MEFKIDTKDNYTIIKPICDTFNATMAAKLENLITEQTQKGSKNFIVSFADCNYVEAGITNTWVLMNEDLYSNEQSLVFTEMNKEVLATIKKEETDLLLNIAMRMVEAIDIISMEILERDLFNEE